MSIKKRRKHQFGGFGRYQITRKQQITELTLKFLLVQTEIAVGFGSAKQVAVMALLWGATGILPAV